ncbi:hypothetical protein KXD40_008827 [Peronospora effusa]|uniref:Uncharacterized protein n=1 Tax=Peronospora effusa TaxID=542832 RepID=A0A3M6VBC6_9STRA|nr:hypothetical protein DD238_007982 [Peronospora effusa]UIZ21805.1 hypothetical protein KXD40_008827 [Peronospora effusa]
MTSSMVEPAVQQLLSEHKYLEIIETGEGEKKRVRIKCQLTQHEMPMRTDIIATHLMSKKFLKARDWYCHDYSQYEPYIVPHRRLPKSLFCNVTNTILNRIPSEVEKHVQGKRYKRMKEHVKITVTKSKDDEMQTNRDFDADAFEFEHSQVIYSDDEDEKQDDGDDELEGVEASKKQPEEEEDHMSDLYPDDESDEEEVNTKDDSGDETMNERSNTKRPTEDSSVSKKTRHRTKKAKKSN